MTILLDTEIIATRIDGQVCFYTIERNGKRWTVAVDINDLNRHGANKKARQDHLAHRLNEAMLGPPDA